MNRKRWKSFLCVWLTGAIIVGAGDLALSSRWEKQNALDTVYAAGTPVPSATGADSSTALQKKIDEAQQKQKELEEQKTKTERDLQVIRKAKENVEKYVKKLDKKLNELTKNIEENQAEIIEIQDRMDALDEELARIQERQLSQYESTKQRIKYMYENANDNYITMLLEAKSLADLCSRAEYIEKIMAYDKGLLQNFQQVANEVTVARDQVSVQLADLNATKETLKYQKKTVKELVKEKSEQMKIYQGNISDTQSNVVDYMEQISGQEDEIEGLLEQQRQQIAAQEAEQSGSNTGVVPTTGGYAWPLTISGRISSSFGYRSAPTAGASTYHKGIDIAAPMGTSILATKAGKVMTATYSSSAGNYISIYHGGGMYSYYMHCSSLSVSSGDSVKKGQIIGKVGSTGISTGAHLHFGINKDNNYVDPLSYVMQP